MLVNDGTLQNPTWDFEERSACRASDIISSAWTTLENQERKDQSHSFKLRFQDDGNCVTSQYGWQRSPDAWQESDFRQRRCRLPGTITEAAPRAAVGKGGDQL